jgi:CPA2 family monovalent cation:H+ antiporter-2
MDIMRIDEAKRAGEPVFYGDSARKEILHAAGIDRARMIVLCISDVHTSLKALHSIREMRRDLQILVRTRDEGHLNQLMDAGATEVIPDTFEASIMLASHVLLMLGQSGADVLKEVRNVRQARFSFLNGLYIGDTDEHIALERSSDILHSIVIQAAASCTGSTLNALSSTQDGIEIRSMIRNGVRDDDPDAQTTIMNGDILLVSGTAENVSKFEKRILLHLER